VRLHTCARRHTHEGGHRCGSAPKIKTLRSVILAVVSCGEWRPRPAASYEVLTASFIPQSLMEYPRVQTTPDPTHCLKNACQAVPTTIFLKITERRGAPDAGSAIAQGLTGRRSVRPYRSHRQSICEPPTWPLSSEG